VIDGVSKLASSSNAPVTTRIQPADVVQRRMNPTAMLPTPRPKSQGLNFVATRLSGKVAVTISL
jgi:hypothetical protein